MDLTRAGIPYLPSGITLWIQVFLAIALLLETLCEVNSPRRRVNSPHRRMDLPYRRVNSPHHCVNPPNRRVNSTQRRVNLILLRSRP